MSTATASPSTDCLTTACYSFADFSMGSKPIKAAYGMWRDNNLYPVVSTYQAPYHFNATMWLSLTGPYGSLNGYLEMGVWNGHQGRMHQGVDGVGYSHYWGETNHGHSIQLLYVMDHVAPTGVMQGYEISRGLDPNYWSMKLGGQTRGYASIVPSWSASYLRAGGELSAPNVGWGHADTFDMYIGLTATDGTHSGSRVPGPPFIDAGFNGISWQPGEFSWNKP